MLDTILADECTKISNPRSKMTKAILKLKAKNRIAATGTPIANRPDDLYAPLNFLRPGELGSFWTFRERYCITNFFNAVVAYKNLDELRQKLGRVMIRRKKVDVMSELPDITHTEIFCTLNNTEQKYYATIKEEIAIEIMGNKLTTELALTKMIRLKQLTGSAELLGGEKGSSKMDALKELLSTITDGNKVIIFSQFSKMADILERDLKEYNPLKITGEINNKYRQPIIDKFNNEEKNRVLVMTSAGEFGLNIQGANIVINFDLPWSFSKMEQRVGRVYRHGQKRNVVVYILMARHTIDEYIRSVIWKKKKISDFLVDGKDEIKASKLTKNDLLNLLK